MDTFGHDVEALRAREWRVDSGTLLHLLSFGRVQEGGSLMHAWFRSRACILHGELERAMRTNTDDAERRAQIAAAYQWALNQLEAHVQRRNASS